MSHIHTEPGQHDLVVSMYIVRVFDGTPKILMHLHKKFDIWMQFGGHVELNEHPWQAVAHELLEESGYELRQLKLLQPKIRLNALDACALHPQPFAVNTHKIGSDHYHTGLDYVFVADVDPLHQLAEGESNQLKWMSKEEIETASDEEVWVSTKQLCRFVFDELLPNWEQVPAEMFEN